MTPLLTSLARRVTLCVLCAAMMWTARARGAVVFSPPDDVPDAAAELKGIDRELGDRSFAVAAKRLDLLLAARDEPLVSLSDGTLGSVTAWLDQLPAEQRKALAAEYAKAFGSAASQALEGVRAARVAPRGEEFYAVARRYPMTAAAAAALAEAADRAAQLGDFPAAQALYELATRADAPMSDARVKRFQAIKKVNAGALIARPTDLTDPDAAGQTAKPAGGRLPFAGPLPFDAAWFNNPATNGNARFFPSAWDGRIILASWNGVTVLREDGQALWTAPNPKPPGGFATERPNPLGRGVLFAPAVLGDVHGRATTVVVRQPSQSAEASYALRAFNAADGNLLWSTETSDARKDVTYAGLPAVCGRYVYSLAASRTGISTATLMLSAADVATGQAIWQTALGSVVEQGGRHDGGKFGRNSPLSLETFAELSEPAVAGDVVLVSPNCGAVIAVGRFDGRIRWVHVYREPEQPRVGVKGAPPAPPNPGARLLLSRYRNTPVVCRNVVIAMPQDFSALMALDRASGKRLWETDIFLAEAFGVAGASGDTVVLCGANLSGIDAGGTGKLMWTYAPPRGTLLTGPAVVVGQTVIAPTTGGLVQRNVSDGTESTAAFAVPSFRKLLATEGGKKAVASAGAVKAFGVPPAPAPAPAK